MKLLATLFISTLIAPGIGLSMDRADTQEDQDVPEYHQQEEGKNWDRQERQKQRQDRQARQEQRIGSQDRFLTTAPSTGVSMEHIIGSDVKNRSNNETIGTVEDVLIDRNGRPQAAVIAVDQVLGIGEKDVALSWNDIEVRAEGEERSMGRALGRPDDPRQDPTRDRGADPTGTMPDEELRRESNYANLTPKDYVLVVNLSEEDLQDAPEFNRDEWDN